MVAEEVIKISHAQRTTKIHLYSMSKVWVLLLFGLILAYRVTAQTFTVLHAFTTTSSSTNSDGANPYAGLVLSGNTLYGTARNGGASGKGTIFKINTDGSGFAVLHTFIGNDGANPYAGLVISGDALYGTTYNGGGSSNGTVFEVDTNGTGFTTVHSFGALFGSINSDGANPYSGLIISSNKLYGTAQKGGSLGSGTVFKVNTDGSDFTVIHTFTAVVSNTNSDGAFPSAGLTLSENVLYGTAGYGGFLGVGALFGVNTDGTGFTNLTGTSLRYPSGGSLILSGSALYGTSSDGNSGAVFKINTNGTGFTNFYWFTATSVDPSSSTYTNRDGQFPQGLILFGNTLYGTANAGGVKGGGTVFRVNTDGRSFTNLHSFTNYEGAFPYTGVILSGNTLYGTAMGGGVAPGCGTVFGLSLPSIILPRLTIIPFGADVILTWPTNVSGFTLQSATDLVSPVVWTNVSPGPVVVNGSNTVLSPVSGTRQFFRLSQ